MNGHGQAVAVTMIVVFLAGWLVGQWAGWQDWNHRRRVNRLRQRREQA